jgi:hypothetical protein
MEPQPLTPYEAGQVERIAAWKARRPGVLQRTADALKRPFDSLFERLIPADKARKMLSRLHRAADWNHGRSHVLRAVGIDDIDGLRRGPLNRCDALVRKVEDLGREAITAESLLANVGGVATELLELPGELMLALQAVHWVAACYGYRLGCPGDETLVLAIIGLSLLDEPDQRQRARRLIRELEEGKSTKEDEQEISAIAQARLDDEMGDTLVEEIGTTVAEEKVSEGIPIVGATFGLVLDNAFIHGVEEAANFTFQERWLRDHGKVDEIAPAEAPEQTNGSIGASLTQAAYSTSYAVSFGLVFPAALIAQAGVAVLPVAATRGLKDGSATAKQDVDRLLAGLRGEPEPVPDRAR